MSWSGENTLKLICPHRPTPHTYLPHRLPWFLLVMQTGRASDNVLGSSYRQFINTLPRDVDCWRYWQIGDLDLSGDMTNNCSVIVIIIFVNWFLCRGFGNLSYAHSILYSGQLLYPSPYPCLHQWPSLSLFSPVSTPAPASSLSSFPLPLWLERITLKISAKTE